MEGTDGLNGINSTIAAIILAGGKSSRMGKNKALLPFGEKTILWEVIVKLKGITDEIIIVSKKIDNFNYYFENHNIKVITDLDINGEKNPLIGMYTGLSKCQSPYAFITGCDMPFLNTGLIKYMMEQVKPGIDLITPFYGGHYQPLYSIYGKGCLKHMESLLERGIYKINSFFDSVKIIKIGIDEIKRFDSGLKSFININTKEEYINAIGEWDK